MRDFPRANITLPVFIADKLDVGDVIKIEGKISENSYDRDDDSKPTANIAVEGLNVLILARSNDDDKRGNDAPET